MSEELRILFILPTYSDGPTARLARIHDIIHNCYKVNIKPYVLTRAYNRGKNDSKVRVIYPQKKYWDVLDFLKKIREVGKSLLKKIDVVHVASGGIISAYLPMQLIYQINPDIPIVYGPNISFNHPKNIIRNPEYFSLQNLVRFYLAYLKGRLCYNKKEYDALLFQGEYHKKLITGEWNTKKKSSIFRAKVSTDLFNPINGNKSEIEKTKNYDIILGYASGARAGRGLSIFEKAINLLIEKTNLCIEVLIAGAGINSENENRTKETLKNRRVNFKKVGFVPRNKMPKFYNALDALIFPSVLENSPTMVAESLACGTPVIGSNIPPVEEIVCDNKNALLFETRNYEDLFEKIIIFYSEKKSYKRRAEKLFEKYNIKQEIEKLKNFYISLLEN